jgi:hypothetical protein
MVKLFLDTEFNGFQGKLMSMALVPDKDGITEFYKELEMSDQLDPWVRENVVPHMFLNPCTRKDFQNALANYLWSIGDCTIVADWPDDIRHFCEALIVGPGQSLPLLHNMNFELDFGIDYTSEVPHNALYDARAIRDFYVERENKLKP